MARLRPPLSFLFALLWIAVTAHCLAEELHTHDRGGSFPLTHHHHHHNHGDEEPLDNHPVGEPSDGCEIRFSKPADTRDRPSAPHDSLTTIYPPLPALIALSGASDTPNAPLSTTASRELPDVDLLSRTAALRLPNAPPASL